MSTTSVVVCTPRGGLVDGWDEGRSRDHRERSNKCRYLSSLIDLLFGLNLLIITRL